MNKLLLLATSLICLSLKGFTGGNPNHGGKSNTQFSFTYGDSTLKAQVVLNPKSGFKDLFLATNDNGINTSMLNPKAVSFVKDYIESDGQRLKHMKQWGRPYFDMISTVLTQRGLPVELKYLAVIESDLKASAVSGAGAVGPWQLMPTTARDLGLVVNRHRDDRRNYIKSTQAVARYLTDLYGLFNDWLLVIAAYNCGPAHVYSAIRKSGSRNFWDLQYYLPAESRTHVKKFIATHYIMEGEGGLTTQTQRETITAMATLPEQATDSTLVVLNITGRYNSVAVAEGVQMTITDFNKINPNFDKWLSENGNYDLRLPQDKMILFQANKPQIMEASVKMLLAMGIMNPAKAGQAKE